MAVEAILPGSDERTWALADLAERRNFDRFFDGVATAIADRFVVRIHINVAARWRAYNGWIATLQDGDAEAAGYQRFIRACSDLVACLASRRVVTYSALMRGGSDPMMDVVLRYPNEVTALAAGAALYAVKVTALTGTDPSEPLSPDVAENAAANLQRHPQEAAARFRELLRLTTPWV
jgi:hypothetical protein